MTVSAVHTTGIFCRPSCPASPKAENTRVLPGAREALFAGYRPCRRCRPMTNAGDPAWAVASVDQVEADPTTRRQVWEVAVPAGTSTEALDRWMERTHAMRFAAYLRARRLTAVLHAARSAKRRVSGRGRVAVTMVETPQGPMLAGATDDGICLLEFTDRPMLPTELAALARIRGPIVGGRHRHLDRLRDELGEYFGGRRAMFEVPLDTPGSAFQQAVWAGLRGIPFGTTVTYAELAAAIGQPGAARAVGHANGSNRVAIVVPCHRVVAAGGGLGGYGGGLDRKQRLLDLEAAASPSADLVGRDRSVA
jgi:AraC family transcriptional regulator of adaptative response/methylated-DNA-[protein]-cysteine methyltransferase